MKNEQRGTVIVSALFAVLCLAQTASAFYAPNLQRWVNRDPLGEIGGKNLYTALRNEPLSSLDRFGLDVAGPYDPTPAPAFDPSEWKSENCLAYALNRPCNKEMYPGVGSGSHNNCGDLKKAMKDNYGALDPTLSKCPPGWHKIRVYPGFHFQRQDGAVSGLKRIWAMMLSLTMYGA